MRTWTIALAVLLLLPTLGAAATIYVASPTREQLVEGHTVFAVITSRATNTTNESRFAAAVAVLVQERNESRSFARFPGVLWFNDQYLVAPDAYDARCDDGGPQGVAGRARDGVNATAGRGAGDAAQAATFGRRTSCDDTMYRYPCTGAVIAANQGDPDPRTYTTPIYVTPNYVESYLVTDPNDHRWLVDRWTVPAGTDGVNANAEKLWTVAILGAGFDATMGTVDDGVTSCAPYVDGDGSANGCPDQTGAAGGPVVAPLVTDADPPFNDTGSGEGRVANLCAAPIVQYANDPGDNGIGYPTLTSHALKYNAVLFFFLDDLDVDTGAVKDHTPNSADRMQDASGCDGEGGTYYPPTNSPDPDPTSTYQNPWPCPGGDDDREGNSHDYAPRDLLTGAHEPYPVITYDGKGNHGGSAPGGAMGVHATRQIDLWYGTAQPPLARNLVVNDVEGSTAPYYCEDETPCNQQG